MKLIQISAGCATARRQERTHIPLVVVRWSFSVVALGLSMYSGLCQAQQRPSANEPSRLEQRFEKPAVPESKPAVEFPAPEQAPPPEKAGGIRFTLLDLVLDGGKVYPADE